MKYQFLVWIQSDKGITSQVVKASTIKEAYDIKDKF